VCKLLTICNVACLFFSHGIPCVHRALYSTHNRPPCQ
jgi:hypothetical protein